MILGIDTSSDICAVGLSQKGRMISDYRFYAKYRHVEKLPDCLDRVLGDTDTKPSQISGIAVSIGPGSFTGLRIGLALAKGLAFGWDKPLLAVPSMQGLLVHLPACYDRACIFSYARKGQYYRGLFSRSATGWQEDEPVKIVGEPDLGGGFPEGPFVCLGESLPLIAGQLGRLAARIQWLPEIFNLPSGYAIAYLGEKQLEAGETAEIASVSPFYIQRFKGIE